MRQKVLFRYLLLGLLLMGAAACGNKRTAEEAVANVQLFRVENGGDRIQQEFPGRVKAAEEVNMAFKVSGTLMRVCVEEGAKVRKGQLIAEIDPRDYQIQLDAAEAQFKQVKAEAGRVMKLFRDSVTTADANDKARYGLQQVTAKYDHARNQLAYTKIYAPFDGFVQKRLFEASTVVAAGMPVVTVVSDGQQEIEINIPASAYVRRADIASFSTSFDFLPEQLIALRLISMAPKANANQLYTVRLAIPQELKPQPSLGMNTMVRMTLNGTGHASVKIPSSALLQQDGKSCVWIYQSQEQTVQLRTVTVGQLHADGSASVGKGLVAGELVVTSGVHKLREGQRVKPMAEVSETNVGGLL